LNEITPEKVARAARLVKQGKVYDLGRVLHSQVPRFPGRYWQQTLVSSSPFINQRREDFGGTGWGQNQLNWVSEIVTGTYQIGTQLDGLNHLMIGDRFYNGYPAREIIEEWGTNKLGIETVPPIVTRGILVDLTEAGGGEALDKGEVITVARVEDFLARHGLAAEKGDALLFHTGWGRHWAEDPERFSSGEPGPGMELARWILAKGIAVAGCDTWSFGAVPSEDPARPFEVPQMLNVKHGLFILENLATEELARDGIYEFLFVVTHAKTKGSTAAQVSPAAVV
jgi:kynurenine formamidase